MADKVGEGYIEIDARIDERNFVSMSGAVARRAAENFGDKYAEGVSRSLRNADRQFDAHINRQISSFQALEKQRVSAAENTARRLQTIQNKIAQQTLSDRRLSDAYEKEGQRAAANFEREQMASFNRITRAYSSGLTRMADDDHRHTVRMLANREREVDHHGRRTGDVFSRHLFHAFEGAMSLLPSRLESLFTRTGPILGTVLMTSLITGMAIAVPAMGAILGGALTASLGIGAAVAAAFVGAANDPRVAASARRISQTWLNEIINAPETRGIGQALADQLDRVNVALGRWAPHINSILNAGARFLTPITTGLIGMVDAVIPALDRFINSPFMKDIMDIFGSGLIKIGEAFGVSFDRILADPKAMAGMKRGLEDIFDLTAGAVKLIFDLIRKLAATWEDMNTDPDGPGPRLSTINTMRDAWKQLKDILDEVAALFKEIAKLGSLMDSLFGSDPSGGSGGNGENPETRLENFTARMRELNEVIEQGKTIWHWYQENWPVILAILQGMIEDFLGNVKGRWNESWGNMKGSFGTAWDGITVLAVQYWTGIQSLLETWLAGVRQRWNESWGNTKQFFSDTWTQISQIALAFMLSIFGLLDQWLQVVKSIWNQAWQDNKQFYSDRWTDISHITVVALDFVLRTIETALTILSVTWNSIWGGMFIVLAGIWNNITTAVRTGINNVLDIINAGIGVINKALEFLGVSFRIPPITAVGGGTQPLPGMGNFSRMRAGGPISGPGTGTSDSVPILASNGEYVVNARSTSKWFPLIHAINNGRVPGFADGGYVSMFKWIKDRVPGVSLSSGFRPGDPGYHGKGMAVDLIFSDGSERRGGGMASTAFNLIKGAFMPAILELIWDFAGANAVWNGKNHFFTGSGAGPGTHDDHIHWAQGGGGGGLLGGLFEWLGKGWNALLDEVVKPMKDKVLGMLPESNAMMAMGRGWISKTIDQVVDKIKVEFDQAQEQLNAMSGSAGDQSGNGLAGALRWSGVATQALQMLGLPLSWLGPLLTLIGRESGGNPNAINRWDSNAARGTPSQGLMQTIPGTFNAYKFPGYNNILAPLDNILAGLRYIVARYGSIFSVQQANSRMSPAGYANGGIWKPGQLGINETRKPEAILNQSQWAAMANGGNTTVKVYIDGVEVAHKAVVEKNNNDITQAFRRGRSVF